MAAEENQMKELYDIYRSCFPECPMTEDIFTDIMKNEKQTVIPIKNSTGDYAGFSVVSGNCIRMLCVRPDCRGKNFGKTLLRMSEGNIAGGGHRTSVIGGKASPFFMIGAADSAVEFFKKNEYIADGFAYELKIPADKPDNIPDAPEGVSFDFFKGDKEQLLAAVKKVEENWLQYFDSTENVLCGYMGDEIVSFCFADSDDKNLISREGVKTGSIGCVGTVPEHRRKGIGLAMVAAAAEHCRKNGSEEIFIHYTHLDKWYGKLGAVPVMKLWFCEKVLPDWGINTGKAAN